MKAHAIKKGGATERRGRRGALHVAIVCWLLGMALTVVAGAWKHEAGHGLTTLRDVTQPVSCDGRRHTGQCWNRDCCLWCGQQNQLHEDCCDGDPTCLPGQGCKND